MVTIKTNDNKNFDVYMNADMFVVPNPASRVGDWTLENDPELIHHPSLKNSVNVAEANSVEFDIHTEKLIQLWMLSKDEDSECDNLNDHSVSLKLSDSTYLRIANIPSRLPLKMVEDLREGDVIDILFPLTGEGNHYITLWEKVDNNHKSIDANDVKVNLHLHMTAKQQGYRYQRFGNFEEVVKSVS